MAARWCWRTFWYAFVLTLCVCGLVCACLVIEYNIQLTTYGRVDFGVAYTLPNGVPRVMLDGQPLTFAAVETAEEALLPSPVRLPIMVWRRLVVFAEQLWETIVS